MRYAITDRRLLGADEAERADALVEQAARLTAQGDISYVQLREKDLPASELAKLARRMLEALRADAPNRSSMRGARSTHAREDAVRRPKLLINARADVAAAVAADGVHLTSAPGELTPEQVRAVYAEAGLTLPIVSVSCHTMADVIAARGLRGEDDLCFAPDPATAPDLILFGPVFEKRVADDVVAKGTGLELLRRACAAAAPIPVLALGGVTEANAGECLEAGAAGIAGIRLFVR